MGLAAPWHVESSRTRDGTLVPCIGRQILTHCTTGKSCIILFIIYRNSLSIISKYSKSTWKELGQSVPEVLRRFWTIIVTDCGKFFLRVSDADNRRYSWISQMHNLQNLYVTLSPTVKAASVQREANKCSLLSSRIYFQSTFTHLLPPLSLTTSFSVISPFQDTISAALDEKAETQDCTG